MTPPKSPTARRTSVMTEEGSGQPGGEWRGKMQASHDGTLAEILALALWLKDGGPVGRLEQYRDEVVLQLRASGTFRCEESAQNGGAASERPGRPPGSNDSLRCGQAS